MERRPVCKEEKHEPNDAASGNLVTYPVVNPHPQRLHQSPHP